MSRSPIGPLAGVNVAFSFSSIKIRERAPRRGPRRSGDVVTLVAHVAPGEEAEEPKLRAHAPTITMAR